MGKKGIDELSISELSTLRQETDLLVKEYKNKMDINIENTLYNSDKLEKDEEAFLKYQDINKKIKNEIEKRINFLFDEKDIV
jgi:hypothetical protein